MESNNNDLINTELYSLSEIFSTEHRKIIIPDFQRDYCWGDKIYGEKNNADIVSSFFDTLNEEYLNGDTLLGKIDVYENPKNHIYLTDGQQRLTTLYLLIGMLYRIPTDEKTKICLKNCLISNFEENKDDKEPYLQYSIRESSLFFLRDLVNEFFLKPVISTVSDITSQPWYFNEYSNDPTIISILNALHTIEKYLVDPTLKTNLKTFANFIINNVKIQYYDVKDRKHGEERFVIINTTGKGLTTTENLKPILLGKITNSIFSDRWEERETWFWKNRDKKNDQVADNGVNDFLTWCFQIIYEVDDIDLISKSKEILKKNENQNEKLLEHIEKLFESLIRLISLLSKQNIQQQFKFINNNNEVLDFSNIRLISNDKKQNVILPLLSYIEIFNPKDEEIYQFLRRLRKNHFDNQIEFKERKSNAIDWRHILQILEYSFNEGTPILEFNRSDYNFKKIPNVDCKVDRWYNKEEKAKFSLKKSSAKQVEEWEDIAEFMGDLSPLFKIALVAKGESINESKDWDKIELSDIENISIDDLTAAYTIYHKLLKSDIVEIRNRMNLLKFSHSRGGAWSGDYSFGRKHLNYFRQGANSKPIFYQSWFYTIIVNTINKSDNDIAAYLKQCNKTLLKHYKEIAPNEDSMHFFTQSSFEEPILDFSVRDLFLHFKRPSSSSDWHQRRHYFHWLGYVWYYYYVLEFCNKKEIIYFLSDEIIYDTYNQEEDFDEYNSLGNQFLRPWTKATNGVPTFEKIQTQKEYQEILKEIQTSVKPNDDKIIGLITSDFLN